MTASCMMQMQQKAAVQAPATACARLTQSNDEPASATSLQGQCWLTTDNQHAQLPKPELAQHADAVLLGHLAVHEAGCQVPRLQLGAGILSHRPAVRQLAPVSAHQAEPL